MEKKKKMTWKLLYRVEGAIYCFAALLGYVGMSSEYIGASRNNGEANGKEHGTWNGNYYVI